MVVLVCDGRIGTLSGGVVRWGWSAGVAEPSARFWGVGGQVSRRRLVGRARSTLAVFAASVFYWRVVWLWPTCFVVAGLTRTVTCASSSIRTFCVLPSSSGRPRVRVAITGLASVVLGPARSGRGGVLCLGGRHDGIP